MSAGLPAIEGKFDCRKFGTGELNVLFNASGCVYWNLDENEGTTAVIQSDTSMDPVSPTTYHISAFSSDSVYGNASTVQSPAICAQYVIRC